MTADDRKAMPTPLQDWPPIDFHVSRMDPAHWTITPVSRKAKAAAIDLIPHDLPLQRAESNALLLALRAHAFSILYHGPAGPIRL
jgi:hypothetical protein